MKVKPPHPQQQGFGFEVQTVYGKTYYLIAETEEERQKWMGVFSSRKLDPRSNKAFEIHATEIAYIQYLQILMNVRTNKHQMLTDFSFSFFFPLPLFLPLGSRTLISFRWSRQ